LLPGRYKIRNPNIGTKCDVLKPSGATFALILNKSELQNVSMTETKQTVPYKPFCLNRNSERIPRRFCLTAVLRGLRGSSII
jgi:hypothetical protein